MNTPSTAEIPTSEVQMNRVAQNVVAIAASTMLARGIQFGWALLLARLLGEAGYGVWGVVSGMITIAAALVEFGMGMIVLRDVAQDRAKAGAYLGATLSLQPVLSLGAYVLLTVAAFLFNPDIEVRLLVFVAGLSLFADMLGNLAHNQLLAAEQMVITSLILIAHIILMITFALVALLSGGGLPGLYLATFGAGLLRALMYWLALRHTHIRPRFTNTAKIRGHLLREGLPIMGAALLTLLYQQVDRLLVYNLLSKEAAGNLMTSFVIVFGVVELTNTALLTALFPYMSRMSSDRTALQAITDRVAFLTLVLTLPIATGIATLAPLLAGVLFPGFVSASQVLSVVIWHTVVAMVGNVYGQQMIIQNRQRQMLLFRAAGLGANIALNVILLPIMGVVGAGVAIFFSQCLILALLIAFNRPAQAGALAGAALKVILAGMLMLGIMLSLRDLSPIVAGVAGVGGYGLMVLVLRALSEADWTLVRRSLEAAPLIGKLISRLQP